MDFAASLFLISTELFANSCAPYACIGQNARPIDEPEEQQVEAPEREFIYSSCSDTTWRVGIEMTCEQARIWDQQRADEALRMKK